jgi:bifunctional ADP-heptose synthase (sugar kinase/adenylyltransferase)
LGKSGKEPILAVRRLSSEKFAGGVLAVANHLAEFTPHVRMITALGKTNSHEEFIRSKLSPTVDPKFLFLDGVPTIVKERFIEEYPFQKMFEVYLMGDYAESERQAAQFRDAVAAEIDNYDLVIVTDYGHGLIEPGLINLLCSRARCLAVNTQANAGNHGFNTVSKYPRADYICISEGELRLEVRQRTQELKSLVAQVAESLGCVKMTVTRGRSGILCYDPKSGFVEVPAFTGHHTDRVGAGDAVFAITSLCMAQGAPADVLGIVGNAVGAMAVGIVGNRTPIVRSSLSKFITTLFK